MRELDTEKSEEIEEEEKLFNERRARNERLQYWDYLRNANHFFSYQNSELDALTFEGDLELRERVNLY